MNLRSDLTIRTPEGVLFSYAIASPVMRCVAWAFDLLVVLILNIGVSQALGVFMALAPDLALALIIAAYFLISMLYGVIFEWAWRGQTIGKRLTRLRVMDAQGFRLQFHQVLLRNLVRAIDLLPGLYLVGGIAASVNRLGQRLGDLAGGTVVVHIPKHTEPDLAQLLAGKFNSLREHPHLTARLRQRVSPEEAQIALQALLRRDEIEPAARVTLFRELADHFRELVPFPAEAVETVPDEQYVRDVVDVLFRRKG